MKKLFPLHIQILIGLVAGAILGAIFSIDHNNLNIRYYENDKIQETSIKNWHKLTLQSPDSTQSFEFGSNEQTRIIKKYQEISKSGKVSLIAVFDQNEKKPFVTEDLRSLKRSETIATYIKPIGTLFINLLSFLAIPLVLASLITGAASLEDVKKLGRIGLRTLLIYITTTVLAITIGLLIANVIQPGNQISENSKSKLMAEYQQSSPTNAIEKIEVDIIDFIVTIVPRNPINAMASGNMLQIVFFAVFIGVAATFVARDKSAPVIQFFSGLSDIIIQMVHIIMKIAPFGVFALIAATVAEFGFDIISTLIWYMLAVLFGLLLHTVGVYGLIVKIWGKMSPRFFFKGMRTAHAISFSTSSSAATLPVTMDCVENNLGVPKQISGFVLPLGATINMDGTALYQGVAAVFIAQVFGIELTLIDQLTIVFTAVLASIGTAPVPGVGIIMLVMILESVHIPPQGIALILGVDRILDMLRTITNISGDAAVAVAINGMEKK